MANDSQGGKAHVVNDQPYAMLPEALLYDPSICAEAVRVYGVLHRHGTDPENCYPGHARIASFIGRSSRSVPDWIRQLEEAGWVTRHPRKSKSGDWDSNGYTVHSRAVQRGVRAGGRGGSTASGAEGLRPGARQKRASEREQLNDEEIFDVGRAKERGATFLPGSGWVTPPEHDDETAPKLDLAALREQRKAATKREQSA